MLQECRGYSVVTGSQRRLQFMPGSSGTRPFNVRGDQCLLIGVKQTQCGHAATSESDPKQSFDSFDVCIANDLSPPRNLSLDPGAELFRFIDDTAEADICQAALHVRLRRNADDLMIEPFDNFLGCSGWSQKTHDKLRFLVWNTLLRESWHVRNLLGAFATCHGKYPQRALLDVWNNDWKREESNRCMSSDCR